VSLFKKKSSEFDEQENQGPEKSKGSLLVLLVLLAGLAYLYFFTSLIVPHETPVAKAPDVSSEVKQSMPPKPAAPPANPATADAKKPEEAKPGAPPASPAPSAAKPAVPPVAAPATVKPVAPPAVAPVAAKPAVPPAVAQVPVKPSAPAPQPQAAAKPANLPPGPAAPKKETAAPLKKDEPKAAKAAKAAEQKPVPVVEQKSATGSVKAPAAEKPVVRKKPASYAIFVGEFPAGEETAAAEAKLARLGIKPVTRQETKKSKSMNRLFFGAYTDYDEYSAALDKLRQSAKGAFGVEKEGKYYLYAGSFSAKERVEKEKRDLAGKGITLQTQLVVLPLSSVKLTAGKFASKGEADKAAARTKSEGLSVKVIPLGR